MSISNQRSISVCCSQIRLLHHVNMLCVSCYLLIAAIQFTSTLTIVDIIVSMMIDCKILGNWNYSYIRESINLIHNLWVFIYKIVIKLQIYVHICYTYYLYAYIILKFSILFIITTHHTQDKKYLFKNNYYSEN